MEELRATHRNNNPCPPPLNAPSNSSYLVRETATAPQRTLAEMKAASSSTSSPASASASAASASASGRAGRKRKRGEGYTGSVTSGTANRNILAGREGEGRQYTVSVAIPGRIIANAQSRELRTYLAGQIARALAIFNIDEVVVYDDRSIAVDGGGSKRPYGNPSEFRARVLQYLETPQVSSHTHTQFCPASAQRV